MSVILLPTGVVASVVDDICADWFMVRSTLATWVIAPPVPVTVNVNDPDDTVAASVMVSVETKFGFAEGTLKTPLAPDGRPETVNETCELKPLRPTTLTEYETVSP